MVKIYNRTAAAAMLLISPSAGVGEPQHIARARILPLALPIAGKLGGHSGFNARG